MAASTIRYVAHYNSGRGDQGDGLELRAANDSPNVIALRRYVHRAVDQYRQVIDILVSRRCDGHAARRFFARMLSTLKVIPTEVVTDAAPVYPRVANNRIEADHGRLKHRLRPMRGIRTDRSAQIVIAGHAFMQNLMGHYEIGIDTPSALRVAAAFTELASAI